MRRGVSGSSKTVERVLRGELCTGCGLCASVASGAIEMVTVAPGYSRPNHVGPVTEEAELKIATSCPGNVVEPWARDASPDPYWGPTRRVATGYAADEAIRFGGSSGGAISALLIHALDVGLVDRVLHIAPDPDRPTQNVLQVSRTPAEVMSGAGSRYTASSPLTQIEQMLADGGAMAFVGKPCDVSALRRLGRTDERVDRHIPIMLSFFCGGMPSHDGVERILTTMGVRSEDVVAFRYRGQGWPGTTAATIRDGSTAEMSYADSWGGHLSKEVQFRCKICPDAVGGVADIACADAWYGGETGYPTFEEQDGRSLILARSAAGEALLAGAVAAAAIKIEPLELREVDLMQPSQARRKRLVLARTAALALTGQPRPNMAGTLVGEAAARAGASESARNLIGTIRRIVLGRR